MAKSYRDVEYTKVDLDSPKKDLVEDNSVGVNEGDEAELLSDEEQQQQQQQQQKQQRSLLTFAYYQQFFDVDTKQVALRILGSFVPRPNKNLVADDIRHSPDLYGPFWVTTTLVFTAAIAGNLANYLQAAAAGREYTWVYDFRKVTFSATAIYVYWWLLPFLLWCFGWWRQLPEKYTFLELLCLYGYSLSVYIPVSILWVIQVSVLQWLLVLLSLLLSGAVLARALWPSLGSGDRRHAACVLAFVLLMHSLLAVGFMLYFFHAPELPAAPQSTTAAAASTTTTTRIATTTTKAT